jgi:signal peptidase I
MKNLLNKILSVSPFVFIGLAMIMILQLGISLAKDEVPSVFNRAILYVKTPSMEDTIMTGDLIFVDVNATEYFVQDIISFRKSDQPEIIITHRIVEINDDKITTKGDNNVVSEDWEIDFSEDLIVGKYIAKSAFLGSIYEMFFLNSLNILFALIIIVFLLIAVIEIKNIVILLSKKQAEELEEEKQRLIEEAKIKLINEEKDKENI